MTEDKLCLFLEQEVVNRESRASGYQARKARRQEMWEDGEQARKRRKTAEAESAAEGQDERIEEEEKKNEISDGLFNETVRYSVVNSYVSVITEFYAWQSEGREEPLLPLRGAKLAVILKNVRRNEE